MSTVVALCWICPLDRSPSLASRRSQFRNATPDGQGTQRLHGRTP
jgi:hypothetical protein